MFNARWPGASARVGRRLFLRKLGGIAVFGGVGLLAACQGRSATGSPSSQPVTGSGQPPPTSALPPVPAVGAPTPAAQSPAVVGGAVAGRSMYQVDPQHTGRSLHSGPRRAVLAGSFDTSTFPTEAPLNPRDDIQGSAAIGPDGTIYIGNFPGNLFALRDGSGDQLEVAWRFHPPEASPLHATPAVGPDGTVYLGFATGFQPPNARGTLYALKAPTSGIDGQVLWSVDLGPGTPTSSPTLGPDGTIYMTQGDGTLFAVAPDGNLRWTVKTGPALTAAPALGRDGTIYLASMDGNLYAVTPPSAGNQGAVKWRFDFGAHLGPTPLLTSPATGSFSNGSNGIGSGASPTIASDDLIYIGANNSNLYAIRPDGSLAWLYEAERELAGIWAGPVLSADSSMLYFGANKGGIYALNRADGALRWRFDVYGSIYGSPALDSGGTLYTGSSVGHVYAIDTGNGEQVFDYDVGQMVWSAPAIRPDGSLVVADRTGRVLVLAAG
jgi:outer membrane protein assembly factor BamB